MLGGTLALVYRLGPSKDERKLLSSDNPTILAEESDGVWIDANCGSATRCAPALPCIAIELHVDALDLAVLRCLNAVNPSTRTIDQPIRDIDVDAEHDPAANGYLDQRLQATGVLRGMRTGVLNDMMVPSAFSSLAKSWWEGSWVCPVIFGDLSGHSCILSSASA